MTNVTVQEALITKFQEAREMLKDKPYGSDDFNMFRAGYEAALSEIDKCEPVCEVCYITINGNSKLGGIEWYKSVELGTKLYTSPQPRDLVVPKE